MISGNCLVSFDLCFVSFSVVLAAGAWRIKSRSPLYNAPPRGCVRGFPIAAKRQPGTMTTGSSPFPYGYGCCSLYSPPIRLPRCHSKVAEELLDRRACFPSDREIRGCRGPTGARRQIKQGGYPWSDTWSHFKG